MKQKASLGSPLVTVILPVYNGARYVEKCLRSIHNQTYEPIEILVVDDGSTDDTIAILNGLEGPQEVIRQPNHGVSHARNVAIRRARGEILSFMDHDDFWRPTMLADLVAVYKREQPVDVVYARAVPLSPAGKIRLQNDKHAISKTLTDENCFEKLVNKNLLPMTASILKRESVVAVGLFDESFETCGDYELWLRMAAHGMKFRYLPKIVTFAHKHSRNLSKQTALMHRNRLRAVEKTFSLGSLTARQRSLRDRALSATYMIGAHSFFSARHYDAFLHNARKALALDKRVVNMKVVSRYVRSWFHMRRNGHPSHTSGA